MGTELNITPSIYQLLSPWGLVPQKQEGPTLPNLITGTKKSEKISPQETNKNDINETPTSSTYEMKNVSLASKIQEIQSLLGKKTTSGEAQQLEFEFAFEKTEEFFLQFSQKTKSVENNLSSVQRETYAEIRQKIAIQFKIGGSISADSLVGFNKASEKFLNSPELLDSFLKIAQGLFANGDMEQWNEFFEGLAGLLGEGNNDTNAIDQFINRFLEQWLQKMFPNAGFGNTNNVGNAPNSLSVQQNNQTSFQFQMEFRFEMSMEIQIGVQQLEQKQDPIVFDLDGDGIELTDVKNGVRFDITGSGKSVQTAWVRGGDALLAWDRNGNGKIDSGLELFGDQWGSANGFEELRKLDSNNDGFIGPEDTKFRELVLWRDNGDGISSQDELFTLSQLGIERIALNYKDTSITADGNNTITQKSFFIRKDNTVGRVADVKFNYLI